MQAGEISASNMTMTGRQLQAPRCNCCNSLPRCTLSTTQTNLCLHLQNQIEAPELHLQHAQDALRKQQQQDGAPVPLPLAKVNVCVCVCVGGWVWYLTAQSLIAGQFAAIHARQQPYQRLHATLQTNFVHVAVTG